jgi:hypothetical protein
MPPTQAVNNRHPLCAFVPIAALLFLILLVSTKHTASSTSKTRRSPLLDQIQRSPSTPTLSSTSAPHVSRIKEGILHVRLEGTDGNNHKSKQAIRHYHCAASATHKLSIVLLHGMSFTKEDWKTSGILQQLCSVSSSLQVTALDLSVNIGPADLQAVLQALQEQRLVARLPVTALVTPSASGAAVSEWITAMHEDNNKYPHDIRQYIEAWIPVASNSVLKVDDLALRAVKDANWPILAIYGDQDTKGKKSMQKLGQQAGATVKELHGRHPVYLDSPTEFILTILEYLNVEFR